MKNNTLEQACKTVEMIKNDNLPQSVIEETADKIINKNMEVWKVTKESNEYLVSNRGRVISLKHGLIKGTQNSRGYIQITIGEKRFKLHRIVANAFIPNPLKKEAINHIDENTLNNNVENLEWVTNGENIAKKFNGKKIAKRKVVELDSKNDIVKAFDSIRECERFHRFAKDSLRDYIRRGTVKDGTHFEYKD